VNNIVIIWESHPNPICPHGSLSILILAQIHPSTKEQQLNRTKAHSLTLAPRSKQLKSFDVKRVTHSIIENVKKYRRVFNIAG
jgi:hypothetical protein